MPRSSLFALALVILAVSGTHATEIDAGRVFADLDADRDGQVAADEVAGEHEVLFKRLVRTGDENQDGRLSAEEFAAALEPVRAEKELVEKQGSRLPGADALAVLLAKMDANRDGRIEGEEVPAGYQRVFEQFLRPGDGDKNGVLDQRELSQNAPRMSIIAQIAATRMGLDIEAELKKIPAEQMTAMDQDAYARPMDMLTDPEQAEQLFRRLDANGDRHLTADEAPGPQAARFEEMIRRGDADGDERLSRREFLAVTRQLAEFESAKPDRAAVERVRRQLLRRFDADGDGALTVRETPPRIAEAFDRVDGDANGRLDRNELTRVAETMARMQTLGRRNLSRPSTGGGQPTDSTDDNQAARKRRRTQAASN
ncbi:MAG TPA: hypothetical protein VF175_10935 [Lacipirellula sp.]